VTETIEGLAARLQTTAEIGDIVRVMKTLASVSIRQYDKACQALETYQHTIRMGLQAVLHGTGRGATDHSGETSAPRALVFIGSDRGLCGNFNEIISQYASEQYLSPPDAPDGAAHLLAVGQRGALHIAAHGHGPERNLDLPGAVGGLAAVARRVLLVLDGWRESEPGLAVDICYNRRLEKRQVAPCGLRLLPTPPEELHSLAVAPWPSRGLPFHRMPLETLLPALQREHAYVKIYRAIADSLASEHARRLSAMQAAERNIDEMLEALHTRHRTLRQEAITSELLDIVAGYESMSPRG